MNMNRTKKNQKKQLWLITCALSLGILGILMAIFSSPIEIPGVNQGVNQGLALNPVVNHGVNHGVNQGIK